MYKEQGRVVYNTFEWSHRARLCAVRYHNGFNIICMLGNSCIMAFQSAHARLYLARLHMVASTPEEADSLAHEHSARNHWNPRADYPYCSLETPVVANPPTNLGVGSGLPDTTILVNLLASI